MNLHDYASCPSCREVIKSELMLEAKTIGCLQHSRQREIADAVMIWKCHDDNTGGGCSVSLDGHDCCYICNRLEIALYPEQAEAFGEIPDEELRC